MADDAPQSASELLRWKRRQQRSASNGHGFDADEWLERDYLEREQAVRDGNVDEHLGKIKHVETSETVKDAIEERR